MTQAEMQLVVNRFDEWLLNAQSSAIKVPKKTPPGSHGHFLTEDLPNIRKLLNVADRFG